MADKDLSVLVGDPHGKDCERPQLADNCGVPLRSDTQFHVLVVFCTSEACTYAHTSPVFATQVEHVPGQLPESRGSLRIIVDSIVVIFVSDCRGLCGFCCVFESGGWVGG